MADIDEYNNPAPETPNVQISPAQVIDLIQFFTVMLIAFIRLYSHLLHLAYRPVVLIG